MSDQNVKGGTARIPSMPDNWQNFLLSIMFHMFLPLLPLIIELWITNNVKGDSIAIVAALYALSIGVSSRNKVLFGVCIVIGVVFSFAYGVSFINQQALSNLVQYSSVSIFSVFLAHAGERWNIHIVDGEKYWNF